MGRKNKLKFKRQQALDKKQMLQERFDYISQLHEMNLNKDLQDQLSKYQDNESKKAVQARIKFKLEHKIPLTDAERAQHEQEERKKKENQLHLDEEEIRQQQQRMRERAEQLEREMESA